MRWKELLCVFGLLSGGPLLASPNGESVGSGADCAMAGQEEWFDDAWTCAQNGRGLAIGEAGETAILATALDDAVLEFETYFGPTTRKVAVIGSANLPQSAVDFMKARGYQTLPWLNAASKNQLRRASIERQVMAQTQSLPDAQRQAILAQALAQLGAGEGADASQPSQPSQPPAPTPTELGALSHEAGHVLFNHFYDGDKMAPNGERRYGSSAPDWIDELAAVLHENEPLTQSRYAIAKRQFSEGGRGYPLPFEAYLTMEHPSFAAAEALRERAGATQGAVAIALSGDEARKFMEESGGDPVQFYVQSRLLADFLIDQSGDRGIIAEIAIAIRSSGSFENWLAKRHDAHGLAGDMAGFTKQWDAWIASQLKPQD